MRRPIAAAVLADSAMDDLVAQVLPSPVPTGWTVARVVGDGAWYKATNGLAACLTVAHEDDGKRWIHLSLSRASRLPSWDELVAARDAFLGPERLCVQVLAPKSRHVNIHPFCLHLWASMDGDPVPDFARGGGVDMSSNPLIVRAAERTDVVAAVIIQDGRTLLTQRRASGGSCRPALEVRVKTETLREELARIDGEIKALESRRRDIHKRSLEAPDEEKVCPDFFAEMNAEEPWPSLQWPLVVSGLAWGDAELVKPSRLGKGAAWVAIRPCAKEHDGRTFLGVLLGDMALSASVRYDRESGVLSITPAMHNPAIWVPDLGRVVFGCESWWGQIKKPEDLRQITDADIEDVWYVRALRELSGGVPKGET